MIDRDTGLVSKDTRIPDTLPVRPASSSCPLVRTPSGWHARAPECDGL